MPREDTGFVERPLNFKERMNCRKHYVTNISYPQPDGVQENLNKHHQLCVGTKGLYLTGYILTLNLIKCCVLCWH